MLASTPWPPTPQPANGNLVPSRSPTMHELERAISDIAHAELPVLLIGEKGSGKETIARRIHQQYGGGDAPFLVVRCSERDAHFFRELFEDRAQAERERSGLSTTVFLDEVAELSVACQNALLKVLVDANGQGRAQRLGARMISSNSRNLEAEIRQERFREDLFYHLNGICLRVPPLRHRQEDIPCLLEFFLKKYAEALSREPVALQEKTMRALRGYSWPGNVRELEELAKKIVVSGEGVALAGLNANSSGSGPAESLSTMLSLKVAARNASRQVERELILKTLERTRWNRKRAARDLGISYKALLYKLKQIALDDATAT